MGTTTTTTTTTKNKEKENEDEKVFLERSLEFQQEGDQLMQKKDFQERAAVLRASETIDAERARVIVCLDASRAECYRVMDRLADAVSAASDALKMNGRTRERGDESEGVREHGERDEGEEGYRASARVVAWRIRTLSTCTISFSGLGTGRRPRG